MDEFFVESLEEWRKELQVAVSMLSFPWVAFTLAKLNSRSLCCGGFLSWSASFCARIRWGYAAFFFLLLSLFDLLSVPNSCGLFVGGESMPPLGHVFDLLRDQVLASHRAFDPRVPRRRQLEWHEGRRAQWVLEIHCEAPDHTHGTPMQPRFAILLMIANQMVFHAYLCRVLFASQVRSG